MYTALFLAFEHVPQGHPPAALAGGVQAAAVGEDDTHPGRCASARSRRRRAGSPPACAAPPRGASRALAPPLLLRALGAQAHTLLAYGDHGRPNVASRKALRATKINKIYAFKAVRGTVDNNAERGCSRSRAALRLMRPRP